MFWQRSDFSKLRTCSYYILAPFKCISRQEVEGRTMVETHKQSAWSHECTECTEAQNMSHLNEVSSGFFFSNKTVFWVAHLKPHPAPQIILQSHKRITREGGSSFDRLPLSCSPSPTTRTLPVLSVFQAVGCTRIISGCI